MPVHDALPTLSHADHSRLPKRPRLGARRTARMTPLAHALAVLAVTGGLGGMTASQAHAAPRAFSGAWFAAKGAVQANTVMTGRLPNGAIAGVRTPEQQRDQASQTLRRSVENLGRAAAAIAAQQGVQQAAREAARLGLDNAPVVRDGMARGDGDILGGVVAGDHLQSWTGTARVARRDPATGRPLTDAQGRAITEVAAPTLNGDKSVDGHHWIDIRQTESRAILNWETFNVGRNTTVNFDQATYDAAGNRTAQRDWAVLNKVVGAGVAPSQIQGAIRADGTVMVVNQNGVVFSGSSQVNVRNLVVAATRVNEIGMGADGKPFNVLDAQFLQDGLYGRDGAPTFRGAQGRVDVRRGALIQTHAAGSSTDGGGYVLLLGGEVRSAGEIATPKGQTVLAAGDSFVIRKGVGTAGNVNATTAGNEVSTMRTEGGASGTVIHTGLMTAATGDITMTGHDVQQAGVAVVTTSTSQRGTIHLSTRASDATGTVVLATGSTTMALLDAAEGPALDSQRDAALARLDGTSPTNHAEGVFDNLSVVADRRDLSRIEIVSGGTVDFQGDSLALATGGEIAVSASRRTLIDAGARLDVSGAVGVQVAMEANNLKVNIQGNEQRDAPVNRDGGKLNSLDVWIDRRSLVFVPDGTNGYKGDRWYTAGGLLEVSGYLATSGHGIGEWMAQGGTVTVTGNDLVTRAGSAINLSGGTLDVASGAIRQSWLRGTDGRLYEVSRAPGDMLYTGFYQGYEQTSQRWGVTEYFYNPILAPTRRRESGYTVGRDAGKLVVATHHAVLEGDIASDVYQGPRQIQAAQAGLDGYYQSQTAAARAGQLIVGQYNPIYDIDAGLLRHGLTPLFDHVRLADTQASIADGLQLQDPVAQDRQGRLVLDAGALSRAGLGAVRLAAKGSVAVESALAVGPGGEIVLYAPTVDVAANLVAHGGSIRLGNVLAQPYVTVTPEKTTHGLRDAAIPVPAGAVGGIRVRDGVALDASGLVANLHHAGTDAGNALAYVDGGTVSLRSTESVTLEQGARIDVSSGAVARVEGGAVGGMGGHVTLGAGLVSTGAGNAAAVLTLDGNIRGHGVKGGGTLAIESTSAVVIGGELLRADGWLQPGESVPVGLVLEQAYQVRAGEALPANHRYLSTIAPPGDILGALPELANLTLSAEWSLPYATGEGITLGNYTVSYMLPGETTVRSLRVPPASYGGEFSLPAGATITAMARSNNFPTNYVVPGNVFPDGIPTAEYTRTALAGSTLAFDVTLNAGTMVAAGAAVARPVMVARTTQLSTALFQSGFSRYDVRSHHGLAVPDGVALDVFMPVLDIGTPALLDSASQLQHWLPGLYLDDRKARKIDQRAGADLVLAAGVRQGLVSGDDLAAVVGDRGDLYVGKGARLSVDPGQAIALSSRGNLTVEGHLSAKGGDISLLGPQTGLPSKGLDQGASLADGSGQTRAITLGRHAVLDASSASYVSHDLLGRPYGRLTAGGSIVIGGTVQEAGSRALASDAFVVIQQGALVDASGGAAVLDVDQSGVDALIASDGGSISIASASGLYLDGTLRAERGAGASGGRLTVALEAPNYLSRTVNDSVLAVRELQLVQRRGPTSDGHAEPGSLKYGHAVLDVDRMAAGGFSALTLYSNGAVSFAGGVDLALDRELRIYAGALAVADGIDPSITVSLAAPYVLLAGITDNGASADLHVRPSYQGGISTLASRATLSATADQIDVKGVVTLGLNDARNATQVERAGFDQLRLASRGDIRFVDAERLMNGASPEYVTELQGGGDILLRAAQVYPATGVGARVLAGRGWIPAQWGGTEPGYLPGSRLVIARDDPQAPAPAVPYSVFGRLVLGAAAIEQNGVVRAPLGAVILGTDTSSGLGSTEAVTLGAGSLTSVSASGLAYPYGGTADGVTWHYDGKEVGLKGVGSEPTITLAAAGVRVEAQAMLDLAGGGELLGAGFVSGRGGSTDARDYPLVQMGRDGFRLPGLDTNPVYAILPAYASAYAPADGIGAVDPLVGQQVTIRADDIPGLAAGTYTLLPSSYALLPGAFRVEVNGATASRVASRSIAMRNGSYATAGVMRVANAGIADSLASQVILTPADTLRKYSQYNETSHAGFVTEQARRNGTVRALLPADAGTLSVSLPSSSQSVLRFQGLADFTPKADQGGHGGTFRLLSSGVNPGHGAVEILADGQAPTAGFDGASVHAQDINAIGAGRMSIGGAWYSTYGTNAGSGTNLSHYLQIDKTKGTGSIVLREGAILRAAEVFLIASNLADGIRIETGAGINTIGQGNPVYGAADGYFYQPGDRTIVAASNGWIDMLAPEAATGTRTSGSGPIAIGICGATCSGAAQLYSEGTLLAATLSDFELSDAVRYGTRNLVLAVGAINTGSNEDLAAAASRGALTSGLALNQSVLDRLLQGDTAHGAPALERLVLTAGESFNLFGSVSLDTTDQAMGGYRLDNLVLSTPAIYGYGDAGDTALITAAKLTWAGLEGEPPTPVTGGRGVGNGSLVVNADVIELGYDDKAQPNGIDDHGRTILGFASVAFHARDRVTANHKGALSVYHAQSIGANGKREYHGGDLTLIAPLLTGKGGSVNRIEAGGKLTLRAPQTGAARAAAVTLAKDANTGAEISLSGSSVLIDTTVALPSGKLTATAQGDLTLADGAYLDLSGRTSTMFDATSHSWGGELILRSTAGNIVQRAGSTIDLSAQNNHAGLLSATALAEGAGIIDLQGTLLGSASGHYDAGGTLVAYRAGSVDIRAQALGADGNLSGQFAALNAALNDGDFFEARSFQLKQGDLRIGNALKAREINISLDQGHLTVVGVIDAHGEQVGAIRLAAARGLTLASGAVLDAHGMGLRVDSHGQIIDSPNRAVVELDAGTGTLILQDKVRIDLRHGTASAGGDGKQRGTLDLYAARLDGNGQAGTAAAATDGDIAIDARGSVDIQGARSIAVYGRQVYDDAPYGTDEAASGRPYQVIDQKYLEARHGQADDFIRHALANDALLSNKLAGLNNALYQDVFHLRPAVEIVSATADGDLVVRGDLDLSGYRYASLNPNMQKTGAYGSGEVGQLTLRAGGDLSIYGSINDGFAPPPATPDDEGWFLTPGVQAFGGDVVVPVPGVTLAEGTIHPKGKTLNYAITASNVTLPSGTALPVAITLGSGLTLPAGAVLAADVLAADGVTVLLKAGSPVGEGGLPLPANARLQAGTRLPVAVTVASLTWPAGVALPVAMTQQGSKVLPVGALIAAGTHVALPDGAVSIDLRPRDAAGNAMVRSNWAVARMLPAGARSWSMRLAAGADIQAADRQSTRLGKGNLILADTHYMAEKVWESTSSAVWYWAKGNYWNYEPGTPVDFDELGGYNVCEVEPGQCVEVTWVWSDSNYWNYTPGTPVDFDELGGYDVCQFEPDQCARVGGSGEPELVAVTPRSPVFSVLRTGTGDLDMAAGGDVSMRSPYGVYTAGTQTSLGDAMRDAAYNRARGLVADGETAQSRSVLGTKAGDVASQYEALVSGPGSLYQAWYPTDGGNLRVSVGGDLTGDVWSASQELATANASAGNWLWRQGTGSTDGVNAIPTAWWINFGTYTAAETYWPMVSGFTGLGTLGGGNARVRVGGDAGMIETRSTGVASNEASGRSQGIVPAVGSTGRRLDDGGLVLTGGGDLEVRIGGGWNRHADARLHNASGIVTAQTHELYGALVNLRGATSVSAGQVGTIALYYGALQDAREIRATDPYDASLSLATGGLLLMAGDSTATVASRGDLVLGGVGDAGLVQTGYYGSYDGAAGSGQSGQSWFSLWTDHTALDVFSAGGNLAFDTRASETLANYQNHSTTNWDYGANGGWYMLPGSVSAQAAMGSIYYGTSAAYQNTSVNTGGLWRTGGLLQVPMGQGVVALLAGDSIYGGGHAISRSGADASAIATVNNPAFAGYDESGSLIVSNASDTAPAIDLGHYPLFAFGANSAGGTSKAGREQGAPARFYAVDGDIVGLQTGAVVRYAAYGVRAGQADYVGAGPVAVRAGRDIVYTGTRADEVPPPLTAFTRDASEATASGNLVVHTHLHDVSVVTAGRDILYANFDVAGPGVLEISAGGNIIQNDLARLTSIGPVAAGDGRPGAGIVVQAGQTADAADYAGFLAQYLDPANRAESGVPLADQPGKVVKTHEAELAEWLAERYGFEGTVEAARAYFSGLAPEQQRIFARQVYFAELKAGGREYNDAGSPYFGSYRRGRHAIAALFPALDAAGEAIVYQGDLLMYGGAGIHTDIGGDIQVLTPGGAQTYGVEGASPPATSGLITRGRGDIQMYSLGSILLGQSRIMTTFGGHILAWSAAGDINAGRGSKTSVVYTPPRRVYDAWGNVTISPDVPSTGAGIATLNPIPEIAPGDVDLIAPLGTIDAGEAGIRVSGSVNVAALHVINADNIQVQGESNGIPAAVTVNTGALTQASAAATSAATAAQDTVTRSRAAARQNLPSIITVQVLGFGSEPLSEAMPSGAAQAAAPGPRQAYDTRSLVQVVGSGPLGEGQKVRYTPEERRSLGL